MELIKPQIWLVSSPNL